MAKEADPEVARVLALVVAHDGDLLLGMVALTDPARKRSGEGLEQARRLAARSFDALLEYLSERLMTQPDLARQLEDHRYSVLRAMASRAATSADIALGSRMVAGMLNRGTDIGTLLFLYNLPIGFVAENPLAHIPKIPDCPTPSEPEPAGAEPDFLSTMELVVLSSSREQILQVTKSQLAAETDGEVAAAMAAVLEKGGDIESALSHVAGGAPAFFGTGERFFEALIDRTFEALLGKEELVERLEAQRRSVVGTVVTGGVTAAATLISSAAGVQIAVAALVFLYLIPIGVRAAFDTWKERREP